MKPGWQFRSGSALASAAMVIACQSVSAQGYPSKPIRMFAPTSAGGMLDTAARVTATALGQRLGVTVAVDNKPGAGGVIGTEAAVRAAPDGYTLLFSASEGLGILPRAEKLPYNATTDLIPIVKLTEAFSIFAAGANVPANNIREFIALAKAKPGKLTFASTGVGTTNHMNGELLKARAGIDIVHIPYKGSAAAAIPDTLSGRVDVMLTGVALVTAHVSKGTLKVLAISAPTRSALLPDVPTMIESGFPNFVVGSFFGVLAPAGTPQDIIRKLAKELSEIASSDEFVAHMGKFGFVKSISVLEDFGRQITEETRLWQTLAKEQNIKLSE